MTRGRRRLPKTSSPWAPGFPRWHSPKPWVLGSVYGLDAKDQARAVEMLLNHRDLVLHDYDAALAALELFRSRPSLGFSDCLMLESARKAGHLPLGTFDKSLARVEGTQKL